MQNLLLLQVWESSVRQRPGKEHSVIVGTHDNAPIDWIPIQVTFVQRLGWVYPQRCPPYSIESSPFLSTDSGITNKEVRELQAACSTQHLHPCASYQFISLHPSSHLSTSARTGHRRARRTCVSQDSSTLCDSCCPPSIIMRGFLCLRPERIYLVFDMYYSSPCALSGLIRFFSPTDS